MTKRAFITGVTGQDGYYLTEFLATKGYEVHGLVRRSSKKADCPPSLVQAHSGDLLSYDSIVNVLNRYQFDEIYHLAAQSFVKESFDDPNTTIRTNVEGTARLLEAVRKYQSTAKFYFAASSEMFGNEPAPQDESTRMHPRSPYGVSKLAGYHLTKCYREAYGLHASSGILFNHESPRRGKEFVTRKITEFFKNYEVTGSGMLVLGNLQAYRDWGDARDYVRAMWLMLQQDEPDDYVIATGSVRQVYDFLLTTYAMCSIQVPLEDLIEIDKSNLRPAEVYYLQGDSTKARNMLGWKPEISFEQMIEDMLNA